MSEKCAHNLECMKESYHIAATFQPGVLIKIIYQFLQFLRSGLSQ